MSYMGQLCLGAFYLRGIITGYQTHLAECKMLLTQDSTNSTLKIMHCNHSILSVFYWKGGGWGGGGDQAGASNIFFCCLTTTIIINMPQCMAKPQNSLSQAPDSSFCWGVQGWEVGK